MAASIAGVLWQAVRLIRECRRGAVPSGRREGMFPGRYSEIFGLGERLGCILNLGHSFDAIDIALSPTSFQVIANGQQLMVRCPPGHVQVIKLAYLLMP